MLLLAAAIAFGPLGPPQQRVFADKTVRAEIVFRIAHDAEYDTGPAAVSPSIVTGSLTLTTGGRTRSYDLASIFPIHEDRVVIPEHPPAGGCGIAEVFAHRGTYLAVEAVLAEKGCAPMVTFIDLLSGQVAENVVLDHSWDHRFDVRPQNFDGRPYVVTRAETIALTAAGFIGVNTAPILSSWPFVVLHATAANGQKQLFAYCSVCSFPVPAPGSEGLPAIGSTISAGASRNLPDRSVLRHFNGERAVFLSRSDELRYAALQTPTAPENERAAMRGNWLNEADDDAYSGLFFDAVAALAKMVSYDDTSYRAAEETDLQRCRALAAVVRSGRMSEKAASATFTNGCVTGTR
jgi:hypothetical protein